MAKQIVIKLTHTRGTGSIGEVAVPITQDVIARLVRNSLDTRAWSVTTELVDVPDDAVELEQVREAELVAEGVL